MDLGPGDGDHHRVIRIIRYRGGDDLAIEAVDIANGLRRWLASKCYGNWAEEDPTSHEDLPPALA
jgi:hypothetical protein